jgi:serine/threonine-protein kinase
MKVIGQDAADLLLEFRKPSTVVDAIVRFCTGRDDTPESVLLASFPLIRELAGVGLLVPEDSVGAKPIMPILSPGERFGGFRIITCVQASVDTELYQVRTKSRQLCALKLSRISSEYYPNSRLEREIRVLDVLNGSVTPQLLAEGTQGALRYLVMEWFPGVRADVATGDFLPKAGQRSKRRLLDACVRIVESYGRLHSLGVIHGDVHPGNVLIDAEGFVRLVDFGLSRVDTGDGAQENPGRGGVDPYLEPEFVIAALDDKPVPQATMLGEQYSVAVMIYKLIAGKHYLPFSHRHSELMKQIATLRPLPLVEQGVQPWPDVEAILARALAKEPHGRFDSVRSFGRALKRARVPQSSPKARTPSTSTARFVKALLRSAGSERVLQSAFRDAPTASASRGAAGLAYALYRIACLRESPQILSLSELWLQRTLSMVREKSAFQMPTNGKGRKRAGSVSLHHSISGVHFVHAAVSHGIGDWQRFDAAITGFIEASQGRRAPLELLFGRSATLLGCSLLLDLARDRPSMDFAPLRELGDQTFEVLLQRLSRCPAIRLYSQPLNLGIAHGWAGVLWAILCWCASNQAQLPGAAYDRLQQLADLGEFTGRGARWPWLNPGANRRATIVYMPGWCNGSAGFVHLWTAAHRLTREDIFLQLAEAAAWHSWESGELSPDLCCGLTGRAYAMLSLYRSTGDAVWLERAQALGMRAIDEVSKEEGGVLRYSLYGGDLGVALFVAGLSHPEDSYMPLFEGLG